MKKKFLYIAIIILILDFVCLVFPKKVHAYLDPGTGSYMFQLLIGSILAALAAIKIYWNKIKAFLISIFSARKNHENR